MKTIKIPFKPREYQIPLIDYITNGGKRAFIVWHRRAGKDLTLWNLIIRIATQEKGLYFYFLPTYTQGKKIIWDGITNNGLKFVDDFIPNIIIKKKNSQEMKIELVNGSIIQIIGTDNYDAIRGTNPRGCVFSEYAYQNPQAWEVVKPILRLNGGFAIFNTTPQGENHAYDLFEMAKLNSDWYTDLLTVDDTDLVTKEDIDKERKEGMSEEMIQQEYYCSFSGSLMGSYYGHLIDVANGEGRIMTVHHEPTLPVYTSWDLGIHDMTTIWFFQIIGNEIRVIDYYENNNESLEHYAKIIHGKSYTYKRHYLPHDVEVRELSTAKSRKTTLESLKIRPIEVCPAVNPADRIQGTRNILPRCYFDKAKCYFGLRALKSYKKEYDEKKKTYRPTPLHDWASHGADSFGQFAINFRQKLKLSNKIKKKTNFNPYAHI